MKWNSFFVCFIIIIINPCYQYENNNNNNAKKNSIHPRISLFLRISWGSSFRCCFLFFQPTNQMHESKSMPQNKQTNKQTIYSDPCHLFIYQKKAFKKNRSERRIFKFLLLILQILSKKMQWNWSRNKIRYVVVVCIFTFIFFLFLFFFRY